MIVEKILVFGHKNPDTDSVCASITLANLKNKLGYKVVPKILGDINNETKFVLDYFGATTPNYLNDVKVRIKNVKYDKKAFIYELSSINEAVNLMRSENITAIPIIDDKKILNGYITLKEITSYLLDENKKHIFTSYDNILSTLNGKDIVKIDNYIDGDLITDSINYDGNILILNNFKNISKKNFKKLKLIILTPSSKICDKELVKLKNSKVNVIETRYNYKQVIIKIFLSNYIKNINTNNNPITFNQEAYFSDFKQMMHKINHTNYPVVNNKGECLGLIRLTGPNNYEKQKVILVDHNDFSQSVDGIDEAEIIEIIDHHNLAKIGTRIPINFRCKPLGSSCSIIYELYLENKIPITKKIAGLLLSGILSDTLVLKSPTTTSIDKEISLKLAKIAEVNILEYGFAMLKVASSIKDMTINEIITNDFKSYNINGNVIGIGQVITMDINTILNEIDSYIRILNSMVKANYSYIALFISDVEKSGSYVIYSNKFDDILMESFGLDNIYEGIFIRDIVSRKKQVLPNIMAILEDR